MDQGRAAPGSAGQRRKAGQRRLSRTAPPGRAALLAADREGCGQDAELAAGALPPPDPPDDDPPDDDPDEEDPDEEDPDDDPPDDEDEDDDPESPPEDEDDEDDSDLAGLPPAVVSEPDARESVR
ncbi:hypothetical protein [Micromonospora sp. NPDC049274]|uniref:hypothetical protein n=1 Tax=Micromonospora sp. NPDC049274 TaxID=3154829 RepID=UPI0034135169